MNILISFQDVTEHFSDKIEKLDKKFSIASDFFNGLNYWCSLKGNLNKTGVVVYGGEASYQREHFFVRAWFRCS